MYVSISIDDAKDVLEKVLKKGIDIGFVRLQENIYETIVFDSGTLRAYNTSRVVGIGIKVVIGNGIGYGYTTSLDRDSIEKAIDRAIAMAKAMARYGRKKSLAPIESVKDRYRVEYKVNPLDIDPETKAKLVQEVNTETMKIKGIVSAVTRYSYEYDRRIIVSSEGIEVETVVHGVGFGHMAIAKSGTVAERVSDSKSFIGGYEYIEKTDWYSFASEINELAIKASQAHTPSPGTYVAIIDNELIGIMLHEAFGHASEGDGIVAEASVLRGKIGEKIASELVTIVDEGVVEGGYPVPYDDEGTPKRRTIIVENGILKHYLHSRDTATELNQRPTGNARAQDITFDVLVRQTNYYMMPRDWRVEELFKDVKFGIYLKGRGAMGGQVNPSVGTFTFSIGPSYIVRNGEIVELVRGVVVSGNILETLREVDAVANDLKILTSVFGGCGKGGQRVRVGFGGPHVRTKKIVVGSG